MLIEDPQLQTPLTFRIDSERSYVGLKEYQNSGGYDGLIAALRMSSDDVIKVISDAKLKGRGGAGFSTGFKWSCVPKGEGAESTKYLLANADEMEPGTFKDRVIMESDPHQLIEGMIIAAYAIEANKAFIFLRGEYHLAAQRLQQAIDEAYLNGFLGNYILGTSYSLELHLHTSAGRYICGEETALISALEGKRANPRAKPPFPQVSGLFGKPTVVNNVETLCNVPHILRNGVSWYESLGLTEDNGTKLYGVSGRVKKPGMWELPMGTPVHEILHEHAGGMQDGLSLKGFLPGGGSTDFLTTDHLELPMDYDCIAKAGSRMGTGTMIVLDDKNCPVGMVLNLITFFSHESCGWCTPCRDGLPWIGQILEGFENGEARVEDLDTLADLSDALWIGKTFCALAPGAVEPLKSALHYFREDFERHITQGSCPYHDH